jgi:hypothetical protein
VFVFEGDRIRQADALAGGFLPFQFGFAQGIQYV